MDELGVGFEPGVLSVTSQYAQFVMCVDGVPPSQFDRVLVPRFVTLVWTSVTNRVHIEGTTRVEKLDPGPIQAWCTLLRVSQNTDRPKPFFSFLFFFNDFN